jgi:hypothetical protein
MKSFLTFALGTLSALDAYAASNSYQPPMAPPMGNTREYACNLIRFAGICRQYEIAVNAKDTVQDLKKGCESMQNAKFSEGSCPTKGLTSKCVAIVRNYRRPDVIYDNYYYGERHKRWTTEEAKRVCGDLEGEFIPVKKANRK